MNFADYDFSSRLKDQLDAMEKSRRMPHAVIVTGGTEETRQSLASFLSMYCVCTSKERPCGVCSQCLKAKSKNHIDIYFAKGKGKTDGIPVEEIREINRDTAVIAHEANKKVYILENADKRMGVESMNAFLKTLEEPSQDILFILTAENTKAMPVTVLSRCTVLTLEQSDELDDETLDTAEDILTSLLDGKEMTLLKALSVLSTRKKALQVLPVVRFLLCDALSLCVNARGIYDSTVTQSLSKRLTKQKLIALIEVTSDAINKTN
ncbi:MAG: hypothetical protein II225_02445, partial [Ruminococcus sp.]|nr:hypothetical protein [Ruminococcus sp.]